MIRWSLCLAVAVGALLFSCTILMILTRSADARLERVRQLRVEHQQLQQQLHILTSSDNQHLLRRFDHDLSDLQIQLVELMSREARYEDVLGISYEQSVLARPSGPDTAHAMNTLRLALSLKVSHADALLAVFERIARHADMWPHEVRACQVHRLMPEGLRALCVVDFYHWSDSDSVGALLLFLQSQRLRT